MGTTVAIQGKKVVVVMPAYNAGRTLERTYHEVPHEAVDEVLVIDDASHDDTVAVARRLGLTVYVHPENRGYGGNQKTCYSRALARGADIVVMLHPDYQYDPRRIPDLIAPILEGRADLVLGSRLKDGRALAGGMPLYKYAANRTLTLVENVVLGLHLSEMHTGYRAYSRRLLESINFLANSDDFVFDTEVIVETVAAGFHIAETGVPAKYIPEASSISFWPSVRYGFGTLGTLLRYLGWKLGLRIRNLPSGRSPKGSHGCLAAGRAPVWCARALASPVPVPPPGGGRVARPVSSGRGGSRPASPAGARVRPADATARPLRLSVLVPVYNERSTVTAILGKVLAVDLPKEVIVVDDGSTDGTAAVLTEFGRGHPEVRVLRHPQNRGKGAAIRTALAHAAGDVVVIQDADLEYDPADFPRLLEPIRRGEADVVYGSRVRGRNRMSYLRYYLGGRLVSLAASLLYGYWLTDEPTCYKMFRRDLLAGVELEADGFDFCPEVTAKLLRQGVCYREVPIGYSPRSMAEGKKIRARDGLVAIWTLGKLRFCRRLRYRAS
jgi:glycosyltransferase involved in cell wall biosynthesis